MKLFTVMETAYENFDESVRMYLSKALGSIGLEYTHNQIFGVIFDGIKGVMQNAMFYIEDALTEQNVFTAKRKKSIYSLAKISGYEPYYGAAATGTLLGKMIKGSTADKDVSKIYIKNGTTVKNNKTGVSYVISLPTDYYVFDITKPLINHEFKIIQGYWVENMYTALGYTMETIHIYAPGLYDKNYLEVYVDGIKWTQAACMYDMTQNGQEYLVSIGYDNTFDITFGNITYGGVPNEGSTINIRYISHSGTSGNIAVSNNKYDFKFVDAGTDNLGNNININDYMILSIKSPISGGVESDSLDVVQSLIGYNSRSLVLANEDNFKLFLRRFSFIGNMNIWSENDSMIVYICCLSNYNKYGDLTPEKYVKLTNEDLLLTEDQKQMVVSTLENSKKTFAGVSVKFQDPIIRKYAIICYVKTSNEYYKDNIKKEINDLILNYFIYLGDNISFISKSTIMQQVLDSVNNIEFFDFIFVSKLSEDFFNDGYYDKQELHLINNEYKYLSNRIYYDNMTTPGLDNLGNIKLDSKFEMPVLQGGFKYYYDREDKKNNLSLTDAITFIWV